MAIIQADNLVKKYGEGAAAVLAVRGISFAVSPGEWIAVMGESGSGKSTLLSMLGALNTPTSGRYGVNGIDVTSLGSEERADFRRKHLGFVFQSFHLVAYLTVQENVMLPLAPLKMKRKEKWTLAEEALARVGLGGKGTRLPSQISGGEQERVAIARAIVNRPPILLADEPTGNLDTKTTREIMELLRTLNSEGMTILMVTHNPECARYAKRILRLSDGLLAGKESDGLKGGNGRGLEKSDKKAATVAPHPPLENISPYRSGKGINPWV
ncbi:MAG: ABC transporter ATP-binding protein [Syntrophaceae bacterium]|jgi:putative ABC transport system ATP-binding protein|nr:ABC transporter ATP-binding protein [Syntrophaceae bacterium]